MLSTLVSVILSKRAAIQKFVYLCGCSLFTCLYGWRFKFQSCPADLSTTLPEKYSDIETDLFIETIFSNTSCVLPAICGGLNPARTTRVNLVDYGKKNTFCNKYLILKVTQQY